MIEVTPYGNLNTTWFNTAIKILVTLAQQDNYTSSNELVLKVNKDASFIRKVTAPLLKKQMIKKKIGRSGGYKIAQVPEMISLYDIYIALVEDANIPQLEQKTHYDRILKDILKETEEAFINVLKQHYLSELIIVT